MSKGSKQRPGSGYASGYDRIFGKSANNADNSTDGRIVTRGTFAGAEGRRVGCWIFNVPERAEGPLMELKADGSVYIFGKLDEAATADRRAVMLAASDEACNSALQAEPAGQRDASGAVHFYRQKGCSQWIRCATDPRPSLGMSPAAACFEYQTLYAKPQADEQADGPVPRARRA